MAATTAVVAGTAGAVRHHQDQKYAAQANQQEAEAQAQYAAQAQAAADQAAMAQQPASSGPGMNEELQQLAEMHTSGVLTDEEFATAKAQVLRRG